MLVQHLKDHPTARDGLVFTTTTGAIVRQNLFHRRYFRPAVCGRPAKGDKPAIPAALPADLQGLRFHDLRHTAASLFIAYNPLSGGAQSSERPAFAGLSRWAILGSNQ